MKRVLITGANGFVGANLCNALIGEYNVVGLIRSLKSEDRDPLYLLGVRDDVTLYFGDIRDFNVIFDVVNKEDIDIIIHLAAQAHVRKAIKDPINAITTNVMGTLNVLEVARAFDLDYVIIQSSDKVYGEATNANEEAPFRPKEIYSASKASADLIAQAYMKTYDMNIAIVRPTNLYGPADLHDRIIPNMIRACLRGEAPVIYKGVKIVREFLYIHDYCEAIKLLLRKKQKGVFNIGSGEVKSQEEIAHEIAKHFNVKPVHKEPPPHVRKEISVQSVDSTKIRQLGWKPEIDFEKGIELTVEWWKWYWEEVKLKHEIDRRIRNIDDPAKMGKVIGKVLADMNIFPVTGEPIDVSEVLKDEWGE